MNSRLDMLLQLRRDIISDHVNEIRVLNRWMDRLAVVQIVVYEAEFASWQNENEQRVTSGKTGADVG